MQILVLGMHRSGTSTVSRLLNMMGLYFGNEGISTGANIENKKGFWERKDVRQLNDFILQTNELDWYKISEFNGYKNFSKESVAEFDNRAKKIILDMDAFRPWFLKEPRLCLNLDLWNKHLEVPVCIYVYRNPLEVAKSLQFRNGFPIDYSLALWEKYNLLALKQSESIPTHFINYNDLMKDSEKVIESLFSFFQELNVPVRKVGERELSNFIDSKLYRQKDDGSFVNFVTESQSRLYTLLSKNVRFQINSSDFKALDRSILSNYENIFDTAFKAKKIELENTQTQKEFSELNRKIIGLEEQIEKLSGRSADFEKQVIERNNTIKRRDEQVINLEKNLINEKLLQNEISENLSLINSLEKAVENKNQIIAQKESLKEIQEERIKLERAQLARAIEDLEHLLSIEKESNKKEREATNNEIKVFKERVNGQIKNLQQVIGNKEVEVSNLIAKVKSLQSDVNSLLGRIQEKDNLIINHWDTIQSMRLKNRFLNLFKLGYFVRSSKNKDANEIEEESSDVMENSSEIDVETTELRIERTMNALTEFIKSNFDHSPSPKNPLVSIIILNRNGIHHLKRLFSSWSENTIYKNYEILVYDNNSDDESVEYLNSLKNHDIKVLRNYYNDSFSAANNKSATEAKGELLLFLNNDVEPQYGWLNQLVKCYYSNLGEIGLVGAKLIYPVSETEPDSIRVQHSGISFKREVGFIRPYNIDNNLDFYSLDHSTDFSRPSVTAACVLTSKEKFERVGGFDEQYLYGYEDVDLGLKMLEKGYKNVISKGSVLYHHEFGTQATQPSKEVKKRRLSNLNVFRDKWYRDLLEKGWQEIIHKDKNKFYSSDKLKVGIVVTERGPLSRAGDYFTANELASEFADLGWQVKYYAQKEGDWYIIHEEIDVLIILLHSYDLSKVVTKNKNLIKVAWIRNWFDKFSDSLWFDQYDLVFSSSLKACNYIENEKLKKAYYMPIATNSERFGNNNLVDSEWQCDYCFTGSYWNDPREIIELLNPNNLKKYKFHIYGKNWDQIPKLSSYSKGFVKYEDIPKVYANTKLLIDDANRVTKPWGSVNSRVFDALMSGVLVITNGELGAKDVFKNKLPTFRTSVELESLITFYLENDDKRGALVKELREMVISHHTYKHRANKFKDVLKSYYSNSIVIKIPVPKMEEAHEWGDYHFSLSLKKEFEKKSIRTKIELLYNWDDESSFSFSNVLVLRGLSFYKPKKFQNNLMWNISHPDKVSLEEYETYDHVFIASEKWTNHLREAGLNSVSTLLQCTDPDVFKIPNKSEQVKSEILFVGNSRGVYRKIISDLLPTKHKLSIYGGGWDRLVEDKYVKGEHIHNNELYKYYGGAKILLNDHWDDMREKGFISNRIFDALACGSLVVSDEVEGLDFAPSFVKCYSSKKQLRDIISRSISVIKVDKKVANKMRRHVINYHTFKVRSKQIMKYIK